MIADWVKVHSCSRLTESIIFSTSPGQKAECGRVVIHRSDRITGPWEGRLAFQDLGVAQGGLIDTPDGRWFAYLFRDYGSAGRIPYLVPVIWEEDWPVIGVNGKGPGSSGSPGQQRIDSGYCCI
ncbi:MAG: hypothetical protein MZV63_03645 [Marinilabiliales bacterium]|nr:hypothetical protein [Marinilabiliales bacterium]